MAGLPWIPLVQLGANLLGGVLGKTEKASGTSSAASNEIIAGATNQSATTTGSSTQTQNQNSSQTSNQSSTGSSSQNSTQNSNQNILTEGTQTSNQNTASTGTGAVSRLDDETKSMLTEKVQQLMSSAGAGTAAIQKQLADVSAQGNSFDADAFVKGIMASANNSAASELESGTNRTRSRIGAGSDTNSMAALLENKLQNSTKANLAGINASANQTAADITRTNSESKSSQIGALASGSDSALAGLLGNLLNASQTETNTQNQAQTGTVVDNTKSNQTGTQTNNTTGTTQDNTSGTTTGTTNTTTQDNSTQTQNQSGTTGQTSSSSQTGATKSNGQSNDWEGMIKGLSAAIGTTF